MRSLFGFLKMYWTYAAYDVALRLFGYEKVVGWVTRRAGSADAATEPENGDDLVRQVRRDLDAVRRFYPKRKDQDCLPRSLAVFHRARALDLPAELLIGVRRSPFGAHSWVEVGGRVVSEWPGVQSRYTPLKRVAA